MLPLAIEHIAVRLGPGHLVRPYILTVRTHGAVNNPKSEYSHSVCSGRQVIKTADLTDKTGVAYGTSRGQNHLHQIE